jgi:putative NADH-flavin reductase
MRILVIGGTGATGLHLIRQALDRHIEVTAAVRAPDKLGAFADQIRVSTGDVFDSDVVADAAAGANAVLSTIGAPAGFLARGATTVYSRAAAALAAGMPQAGVNRLLFCTSAGVEPHDPAEALPYRLIAKPFFLQRAYDDMTLAETTIRATQLDHRATRPAHQPTRHRALHHQPETAHPRR